MRPQKLTTNQPDVNGTVTKCRQKMKIHKNQCTLKLCNVIQRGNLRSFISAFFSRKNSSASCFSESIPLQESMNKYLPLAITNLHGFNTRQDCLVLMHFSELIFKRLALIYTGKHVCYARDLRRAASLITPNSWRSLL